MGTSILCITGVDGVLSIANVTEVAVGQGAHSRLDIAGIMARWCHDDGDYVDG